jgi:Co/Zn/Cd efflux system component
MRDLISLAAGSPVGALILAALVTVAAHSSVATVLLVSALSIPGLSAWAASTIGQALTETVPKPEVMGAVAVLALFANLAVAALLCRYREGDSQALSVWLCTRNDWIAYLAVLHVGTGVWAGGGTGRTSPWRQ